MSDYDSKRGVIQTEWNSNLGTLLWIRQLLIEAATAQRIGNLHDYKKILDNLYKEVIVKARTKTEKIKLESARKSVNDKYPLYLKNCYIKSNTRDPEKKLLFDRYFSEFDILLFDFEVVMRKIMNSRGMLLSDKRDPSGSVLG